MKVFIADDSAIISERLIEIISDLPGIEIIGLAQGVKAAIESIRKLKPDVVILDIGMPGGNGIDVLENIKKDKSNTTVMMLTNHSQHQYRKKCLDSGADFFFDKSTEFEKMTEVLKQLIDNSGSVK